MEAVPEALYTTAATAVPLSPYTHRDTLMI